MFNEILKETRKLRGFTQSQIANLLNISVTAYGDYERGRTEPDLKCLKRISQILGVTVDYLLEIDRDDNDYVKIKKEKIDNLVNIVLDLQSK